MGASYKKMKIQRSCGHEEYTNVPTSKVAKDAMLAYARNALCAKCELKERAKRVVKDNAEGEAL